MVDRAVDFLATHLWMPGMLLLLTLLPSALFWTWRAVRQRQQALSRFAGLRQTIHHLRGQRVGPAVLVAVGLLANCVGSMGPLWGRNPSATPITVRDLWVVLDLSRSMLAEDRPPLNRIERAQRHLRSLVAALRTEGGYRVGLIAFAGKAKVVCPLTDDYEHFDGALRLASPQSLDSRLRLVEGQDGAAQGTSIAGALALVGNLIDPQLVGFQDVLLASDGDDLAGGWERELARLVQANVRVHCLGLGDPERDALIPTGRPEQPFVLAASGNEKATTRRRDELLTTVAQQGQGVFVREESGSRPLVDWYGSTLATAPRYAWDGDRRLLSAHQYEWFFGVGVVSWSLAWAWSVLARRGNA